MASIRKMRNKWYARVVWRVSGKLKEILIPLKTSSLTTARTRIKSVNNEENDIINGIVQKFQFKDIFRWLNPEGTSRFTSLKLVDIIPKYLDFRETKVRWETHNRDRISLNQLMEFIGESKVVSDIDYNDIEDFFSKIKKNGITHLVIDEEVDNSIILNKIFSNYDKYKNLKKIFDSEESGFKYKIKIFEIKNG